MSEVVYDDGFTATDRYTRKLATNGRMLYFKNGRLTAEADIPEGAQVEDLTPMESIKQTVAEDVPENGMVASDRSCLYGDGEGTRQRYLTGRTVYLCQEHYETMSLGKITQHLRETNGQ